MANVNVTPNMNLPNPNPTIDPGPDWSINIYACMSAIDSHDHSPNKGVQITPAGININADLPFNGWNAVGLRSVNLNPQVSVLTGTLDSGCISNIAGNLYYNFSPSVQVQITNGASLAGAAGTITGLPSGTAGASYSGGTFSFQSATNTPAAMNVGPIIQGAQIANPFTVTFGASASMTANYSMIWPLVQGAAHSVMTQDGSGNMTWATTLSGLTLTAPTINNPTVTDGAFTDSTLVDPSIIGATFTDSPGILPLGAVIATFPNLSGAYSTGATTVPDVNGFVLCQGQTLASGPMSGQVVPNISNNNFLRGNTVAGPAGGSSTQTLNSTNFAHQHYFGHDHQWAYLDTGTPINMWAVVGNQANNGAFNNSVGGAFQILSSPGNQSVTSPGGLTIYDYGMTFEAVYAHTSGVIDSNGGGSAGTANTQGINTLSAASFSILPNYIQAVYLMRAA